MQLLMSNLTQCHQKSSQKYTLTQMEPHLPLHKMVIIFTNNSSRKKNMKCLLLPLATLFLSLALSQPLPSHDASTLRIMHAYHRTSEPSLDWEQRLLSRDKIRHQYLSNLVVPLASGSSLIQRPMYVVRALFGTPGTSLLMAMDTSNDAAWVPCRGCLGCTATSAYDPTASSTFRGLPCSAPQCHQVPSTRCGGDNCMFNMSYGGSTFAASVVQDTLSLAGDTITGFSFGCILHSVGSSLPPQGLLGLGRGPLSLLSQTPGIYQSTFSYCLPNFRSANFSGSLRLGTRNQPTNVRCTQLLRNPRRSSLYYVNLMGISVGNRLLNIPSTAFVFDPNTGGGTIIDSGTTFTRLVAPAYAAVKDEVRRRMGNARVTSVGGFDTCYGVGAGVAEAVRSITLMFDGMSMTLPPENFLIRSGSGETTCLAMAASPGNVNSVLNIVAGFQQQNHRILINQPASSLCIAREICS